MPAGTAAANKLIRQVLGEIQEGSGAAATERFSGLRAVDAKVREVKLVLTEAGAQPLVAEMEKDPDFSANSRRVRLEALANYCATALRFFETGTAKPVKRLFTGPDLRRLTAPLDGLEEVVQQRWLEAQRCQHANAYLAAGADLAFVEGPTSVEEVRRICKEVKGPVFYNQTGVSPRFSLAEMQELGLAVTIIPGATFRATIEAVYDLAVALRDEGPLAEARFIERFKQHPLGDLHTFAGFDRIRAWEEQYLPPEELEKYADSVGHQPGRT